MNHSELIVAILERAGVRHAFGVPSGPTLPLMEALRNSPLKYVLVAHEATAGFMADATGRLTGAPGVCISTLGPGATNLSTGVGNALLDAAPLLAFTCTVSTPWLRRRVQMRIDHRALFAPLTKASFTLEAGNVGETVGKAIRIALSEPPGPVHLDLPEDVAALPANEPVPGLKEPERPPPAPAGNLRKVGEALASARKPVAILGLSLTRALGGGRAREDLLALVEDRNLPFVNTLMAKGFLPDDHPLSAGAIGRARRSDVRRFTDRADFILGLGYDPIEINYEEWVRDGVPVASVDYRPPDVDGSVNLKAHAAGDLAKSIRFLRDLPAARTEWTQGDLAEHRKRLETKLRPSGYDFPPHEALDVLHEEFPEEGLMVYDVGGHLHQIATQWTARKPFTVLSTNGWSSMGYAIPAALAAKLAQPEREVLAILGDGCFQMTAGEMATARRLGLKVPFVVLNDGDLGLIRVKQERKGLGVYGVVLGTGGSEAPRPPAHYFGVPCVGARSPGELRKAIRRAFQAKGPTVIEAFVDGREYSETIFD
ncbi:MAG: thiamine pyrophosphate-binding protein [Nitrospinota bacterium]